MPDTDKLRRMVDAGYSQVGIAVLLGVDIGSARRLVRKLKEGEEKPKRRQRPNDFSLSNVPLSDPYVCNVGNDLYLAALHREHPDRQP